MSRVTDKEEFLRGFRPETNECCRALTTHLPGDDENVGQYRPSLPVVREVLGRLTELSRALRYADEGRLLSSEEYDVLSATMNTLVGEISHFAQGLQTLPETTVHFHSQRLKPNGCRGSPKYNITEGQLHFLVNCRFSKKQIASILHVSVKTVHRRLKLFHLEEDRFSTLSDDELDAAVRSLMMGNRLIGANAVLTRLRNIGVHMQRERVRQSLRRVDPAGVAIRSRRAAKSRVYRVAGPNSFWHLDGNHKLIRWRIVVHGAIDGFSRLITYMKASSNNHAKTVFELFKQATVQYGIPSRIRCDNGGENVKVCQFMEQYHGLGRGSAIRGRSVHNQRIERNWLDMWNGCINVFYDLFTALERDNLLDPNSEEQLYALHFVYLPRIQHALQQFTNQWNHHKMRTEHSLSPVQLFVQRSLELHGSASTANRGMFESASQEDQLCFSGSEDEEDAELTHVNVSSNDLLITDDQVQLLSQQVNPLDGIESGGLGVDIYFKVLDLLDDMLGFESV